MKHCGTFPGTVSYSILALALTLVLVSACAKPQDVSVEASTQYLYNEFYDSAELHGVKLDRNKVSVKIDYTLSNSILGLCYQGDERIIKINGNQWSKASEGARRFVIFHEMGHCALGKGHDSSVTDFVIHGNGGTLTYDAPGSVMKAMVNDIDLLITNNFWNQYTDQLFKGTQVVIPEINYTVSTATESDSSGMTYTWDTNFVFDTYKVYKAGTQVAVTHNLGFAMQDRSTESYVVVPEFSGFGTYFSFQFSSSAQ